MAGSQTLRSRICSGVAVRAEPLEGRLQRMLDDRRGKPARRVVAAGAAALVGRLQDRRARRNRMLLGRAALVDDSVERGGKFGDRFGSLNRIGDACRQLPAVRLFLQVLDAILALGREQGLRDRRRPACGCSCRP